MSDLDKVSPFEAYVYLDIDHPVVAWGVYRGVLVSAKAVNDPTNSPVSMMFASMIHYGNNTKLQNELIIDRVREERFSSQVSRMEGMYFFTERVQAKEAEAWGGHFRAENLAEVGVYPTGNVSRLDSNWITNASTDSQGNLDQSDLSWVDRYWSGEKYNDRPVWETISHGRAIVYGTDLRKLAYEVIAAAFPEALDMLEMSRLAAAVGYDLGQVAARVTQAQDGQFHLGYYLDMKDGHNPDLKERLRKHKGPINHRDLQPGKETFGTPDLREYEVNFIAY